MDLAPGFLILKINHIDESKESLYHFIMISIALICFAESFYHLLYKFNGGADTYSETGI
jgi:hypothetical protein